MFRTRCKLQTYLTWNFLFRLNCDYFLYLNEIISFFIPREHLMVEAISDYALSYNSLDQMDNEKNTNSIQGKGKNGKNKKILNANSKKTERSTRQVVVNVFPFFNFTKFLYFYNLKNTNSI